MQSLLTTLSTLLHKSTYFQFRGFVAESCGCQKPVATRAGHLLCVGGSVYSVNSGRVSWF